MKRKPLSVTAVFLANILAQPDSALSFVKRAYSIAKSLNDTTLLKASSHSVFSFYKQLNNPLKAIESSKIALEHCRNDKSEMATIYSQLLLIYRDYGNMAEAVKCFNRALELCEEAKDYIQIASLSNCMGSLNDLHKDLASVDYHKKALDIYIKMNIPFGIAYTYNLMGMRFSKNGNSADAEKHYQKAIDIFAKISNQQQLAFANTNLAAEYLKTGKTDLAWPHLKKAIECGESIKDKLSLSDAYKSAALYYRRKGDNNNAIKHLKLAETCAKEIKNPTFLQEIYNEFSLCYNDKGDSKSALTYLRLKNEIADTISKQNAQRAYIEMLVKYETLKTKGEIAEAKNTVASLKAESEKRSILLWSIIGGSVLVISVFLFLYWKKLSALLNHYKNLTHKPFSDKRNIKAVLTAINSGKQENSHLGDDAVNALLEKLKKLMEEEKKYLESDLTLNEAARILSTNTAYLSRIINEQTSMNFSNYINKYRIEEAKRLMNENEQNSLTFEGIGKNCGFVSRSAFNQAFKKFTGLTPTGYTANKGKNE